MSLFSAVLNISFAKGSANGQYGQKPSRTFALPCKTAWQEICPAKEFHGWTCASSLFLLNVPIKSLILSKVLVALITAAGIVLI